MSLRTRAAVLSMVAALALMLGVGALSAGSPALETDAGVTVSGHVFYDLNMNGIFDQGPGSRDTVVDGAEVKLLDSSNGVVATQRTVDVPYDQDGDGILEGPGMFNFTASTGLNPNENYTVVRTVNPGEVSTNASSVPIPAGSGSVTVDFGLVVKRTVSGRVYVDSGNAGYTPGEEVLGFATVKIIQDTDGDRMIDYGEPLLGQDVSDSFGYYTVDNIPPGPCIMTVVLDLGGYAGAPVPMLLAAYAMGEASTDQDHVPYAPSALVALTGTVWNDVDGDEVIDAGERGLGSVTVEVYGGVNGVDGSGAPVVAAITGADGTYTVPDLLAGYAYEVRPVPATVPVGWLMGTDSGDLAVTLSGAPGQNVVNVGYFNPFSPSPLRQSDWKKELKQAGKPRYTRTQVDDFIGKAEAASSVFHEVVGIEAVLTHSPIKGDFGQALKEHAALRLNLASTRLYEATPINLPDLTTKKTIGEAVIEIEGILLTRPEAPKAELQRARKLAEAINGGKGLGSGKTGTFGPASATYRGALVVSKLQPAGDQVDMTTEAPTLLLRWSPGNMNTGINVTEPKLRVKVKVFMDGGVLDVYQVQKSSDGSTVLLPLGTIVPPVWNKDINMTYTFDLLGGISTAVELAGTEFRLATRDANAGGKTARVKVDSAELTFKY